MFAFKFNEPHADLRTKFMDPSRLLIFPETSRKQRVHLAIATKDEAIFDIRVQKNQLTFAVNSVVVNECNAWKFMDKMLVVSFSTCMVVLVVAPGTQAGVSQPVVSRLISGIFDGIARGRPTEARAARKLNFYAVTHICKLFPRHSFNGD